MSKVTNVVIAGLGGQGVIKASDIFSETAFAAGYDVKKSELHGMSQRGGSVCSDIRFGRIVLSPMVPPGEADYLVVLAEDQVKVNLSQLRPGGVLIAPECIGSETLPNKKSLNAALLGVLSTYLDIPQKAWLDSLGRCFAQRYLADNLQAFELGRRVTKIQPAPSL